MKVARSRLDRAWICDLMNVLCDIETARNVKRLVDALYVKVNYDELLAPSRRVERFYEHVVIKGISCMGRSGGP
jgi:hypothetical protein